jgi:hypothetical protein
MINLFYEPSYWGHSSGMNGPRKVVENLRASLEQEDILLDMLQSVHWIQV